MLSVSRPHLLFCNIFINPILEHDEYQLQLESQYREPGSRPGTSSGKIYFVSLVNTA